MQDIRQVYPGVKKIATARFGATLVVLVQGDITEQVVDAIVNAAHGSLLPGAGVDGAIHRKGGPAILDECMQVRARQGGCATGKAVITGAGALTAQYVIHTVGPVWPGDASAEIAQADAQLAGCYVSSLGLAAASLAVTIAFPSISTGAHGYPIERAAAVALRAVRDWVRLNPVFDEIRFVLFSGSDLAAYQAALPSLGDEPLKEARQ